VWKSEKSAKQHQTRQGRHAAFIKLIQSFESKRESQVEAGCGLAWAWRQKQTTLRDHITARLAECAPLTFFDRDANAPKLFPPYVLSSCRRRGINGCCIIIGGLIIIGYARGIVDCMRIAGHIVGASSSSLARFMVGRWGEEGYPPTEGRSRAACLCCFGHEDTTSALKLPL